MAPQSEERLDGLLDATEPFLEELFQICLDSLWSSGGADELRRIAKMLVLSIAAKVVDSGASLTTSNGLSATVYNLADRRVRRLLRLVRQWFGEVPPPPYGKRNVGQRVVPNEYYAAVISVKRTKVALIYHYPPPIYPWHDVGLEQAKLLCRTLLSLHKHKVSAWTRNLVLIVYRNRVYHRNSDVGNLILHALENKTAPEVEALIK